MEMRMKMARKKIIDSNACKFSLFITGDNKEILDELANNYQLKYGPMINKIIKTFCRMPKPVKNTMPAKSRPRITGR